MWLINGLSKGRLSIAVPKYKGSLFNSRLLKLRFHSVKISNDKMKVVIGGGSGFIGRALKSNLEENGHEVVVISRTTGKNKITWDDIEKNGLPECDAVVNLAGELIVNPWKRWGPAFKEELRRSRIETNELLVKAISSMESPPSVWTSSSAVGYYPNGKSEDFTEDTPPSDDTFFTQLCKDWEASAKLPENVPTRHVTIRVGVVLGKDGGMIQQSIWPFWLGLGGSIGTGNQSFPWIHIKDICGIYTFALESPQVTGVLNGVAPQIITNYEFTKAYGSSLCRPTIFPLPSFVVNLIFTAEGGTLLLEGPRVIPKRTLELGYKFYYPDIHDALKDIVK